MPLGPVEGIQPAQPEEPVSKSIDGTNSTQATQRNQDNKLTRESAVASIEEHQESKVLEFREALNKYDLVSAQHDPVHGSYVVLAERDPKINKASALRELASSYPSPFTSWTRDERVSELRDKQGLRKYYDMKRADGTVRGALRLLKTPVLSARWFVKPASDSALDVNIAKFVEDNLFNKLNVPWTRVMEDALLMCEYGYFVMEKVYKIDDDGRMRLKKLGPRHPLDVREWEYDTNGGPNAVVMEAYESNNFQDGIRIPIEKLVVFVLEQEGGDMRGISVLRSAYKHYYYKDCKSADTEILTINGWKTHDNLHDNELVLTINPETELSEWQPVEYVRRYPGVHDVIQMESQQISSISTPDHRWLVKDKTWKSPYEFITTENLRQRHIIPRAAINSDIPLEPKYTDNLVELIGWFITEGGWQGSGSCIAQNYDQPFFNRIRACLTGVFGPRYAPNKVNSGQGVLPAGWYEHTKKHDSNDCQFKLNSNATKVVREFVKKDNKVVTNAFILSLTRAQLELFVTTCLRGDGCTESVIRQTNKERLEPIALACMLLGWGVNYNSWKHPDPKYPKTVVYQLLISRTRIGAKPLQSKSRYGSTVKRTTYEGIVWCPKTANGTWLARRNGKVYFTGNTLYKIDAIQKERHGIGVPIIRLPMGFTQEDKNLADELGRNLRTNERAHITIPSNWEIMFAKLEGQPVDCLTSINHHDKKIMSNVLASFMDEPTSKTDSMDMFFKSTRYIARTIADTINAHCIPQLVDFNFQRGSYPKLQARRIGELEDARTLSFAVRNYIGSSAIIPDDVLEDFIRQELDLPTADKATSRIIETPQNPNDDAEEPSDESSSSTTKAKTSNKNVKPARVGPPRQNTSPPVNSPRDNAGTDRSGG